MEKGGLGEGEVGRHKDADESAITLRPRIPGSLSRY